MYDNGKGSSIRAISRELNISRNTVRKYLRMTEKGINEYIENKKREKYLDKYKRYIIHLFGRYPNLSAAKIMRKLKDKEPSLDISYRSVRRYVKELKVEFNERQKRYYEPVLDMVPGCQCQVDGGEIRNVLISGKPVTVYFVVFVLSYSRLMYVSASDKPVNTGRFIEMHNEAFRYFNGASEECVYDQSKLVVISEEFREVKFNSVFYQYATSSGFDIRVCEGYDPESKGKVESGVKYVKNNFFYGEEFTSFTELKQSLFDWIDNIANKRIHGTTRLIPSDEYKQKELAFMKPYLSPVIQKSNQNGQVRKVDKTSLISWESSKYSVPSPYQSGTVLVKEEDGDLIIQDKTSLDVIARHTVCSEKNRIIKNTNHYRDYKKSINDRENEVIALLGEVIGKKLCVILKLTSPKIYKDQLTGLKKVLKKADLTDDLKVYLAKLSKKPRLTTSIIRDHIEACQLKLNRTDEKITDFGIDKVDLSAYKSVITEHEVSYAIV